MNNKTVPVRADNRGGSAGERREAACIISHNVSAGVFFLYFGDGALCCGCNTVFQSVKRKCPEI